MQVTRIEGLDSLLRKIDDSPKNLEKVSRKCLRTAARKSAAVIRRAADKRFRHIVSSAVKVGMVSGDMYAAAGYFNKKAKKGGAKAVSDWQKAYWLNYGTLANRDPSHHFTMPIRKKNVKRDSGIKPRLFYNELVERQAQDEFLKTFTAEVDKASGDIFK